MRFLSFALGGLLLSTVRPALAQTSAATPATPRYYVGLSAYTSYYQQIGNRRTGTTGFAVPLQLTAGYLPGSLTGSSALGLRYRFGR